MITFIIVAILGFLLLLVLRELFRKSRPAASPPAKPAEDLANLKITQARSGDAISVSGAGDQFADLDFTIDRLTRYEAGQTQWSELSGPYRERRVTLEVMAGDDVQTAVFDGRKLTLDDLGLSEDDLVEIDKRQDTGDNFSFENKLWFYRLSKEVSVFRDGAAAPSFYCWRFEEEGGKRILVIRKPEGEPFSAAVAVRVNSRDITVYQS